MPVGTGAPRRKKDREASIEARIQPTRPKPDLPPVPEKVVLSEAVTVKELAEKLNRKSKDVIAKLLPDPTESNPPQFLNGEGADAKTMKAQVDPGKHVLAHVFKIAQDPYVGKMGVFRIHQGTVTRDDAPEPGLAW